MKNVSVFCLQRIAVYPKSMPNSIDLRKEVDLLFILVYIIVSCLFLSLIFLSMLLKGQSECGVFYSSYDQYVLCAMMCSRNVFFFCNNAFLYPLCILLLTNQVI